MTHPSQPYLPQQSEPALTTGRADARRALLETWLVQLESRMGLRLANLRPASSDASFRRYFRVDTAMSDGLSTAEAGRGSLGASLIVMDAPPAKEDCRPFVQVAGLMAARGVNTPQIIASDLNQGFLLLADFGQTTYADALQAAPAEAGALYADALAALVRMQQAPSGVPDAACDLPHYDRQRLQTEMRLFADWYLARHLAVALDAREQAALDAACATLADAALAQPQVLVHRDFHCRNLMRISAHRTAHRTAQLTPQLTLQLTPHLTAPRTPPQEPVPPGAEPFDPRSANPGVLDFQDAVLGPISYDLVSLLRDAYVEWPEAQQIDWAARYWDLARAAGLPVAERFDVFWRDLEWMGLQRSLKVLGMFARLCYRDGKTRYLDDLPVVLRHTQRVVERYDAFGALARLLDRVHRRTQQTGFTF